MCAVYVRIGSWKQDVARNSRKRGKGNTVLREECVRIDQGLYYLIVNLTWVCRNVDNMTLVCIAACLVSV